VRKARDRVARERVDAVSGRRWRRWRAGEGCSAGAGDHLIGMTGSTTRFQVELITPAADAYQARKAVTMPR